MKLDEQIAILQAAKEGKTIQVHARASGMGWYDVKDPEHGFIFNGMYDYRIKPEDRKVRLFLRAPFTHMPADHVPPNCEATFNAEGELIRVELI